jgi:GPH family glycoside/pentoside/hexuronide:cation symporter
VTHDIQNVIFMSITLVPAASCVLSTIPFWFYRLGGPKGAADAAGKASVSA